MENVDWDAVAMAPSDEDEEGSDSDGMGGIKRAWAASGMRLLVVCGELVSMVLSVPSGDRLQSDGLARAACYVGVYTACGCC